MTLHPDKTKIVDLASDGFDFLGFHFRKFYSPRTGGYYPWFWPSDKSMKRFRARVREIANSSTCDRDPEWVIARLNKMIRGWRGYFCIGPARLRRHQLDKYVSQRLYGLRLKHFRHTRVKKRAERAKAWRDQVRPRIEKLNLKELATLEF